MAVLGIGADQGTKVYEERSGWEFDQEARTPSSETKVISPNSNFNGPKVKRGKQ